MSEKIDRYMVRALELAANSEIGEEVLALLRDVSAAGSLAAGGDVEADPQRARRLLAKMLRGRAAGLEVSANAIDRNNGVAVASGDPLYLDPSKDA